MLELKDLSCERGDRMLFSGLSCVLEEGQGLRIVGANGSGKTTLLRVVAGLSDRYTGDVLWNNASSGQRLHSYRKDRLYIGHSPGVKPTLTAFENLHWWTQLNNPEAASVVNLKQALSYVDLQGYEDTRCYQLSAGQQRRVALARLYLSNHKLWILDEPFTAIDVNGVEKLEARIEQHLSNAGMVILTTHQSLDCEGFRTLDVEGCVQAVAKQEACVQ